MNSGGKRLSETRFWWGLLGFGAMAVFFLASEHRAHTVDLLPLILLLACPLLHLFVHGRHEHSGSRAGDPGRGENERAASAHGSEEGQHGR
ncbi:MAG: hypothetical protein K0S81_1860 [Rhodospirillales bacterium]|nr:hypothetical protein [Rhodospirillales bacterium]